MSLFDIPVTDVKGEHTTTVRKFIEEETSSPWWSSVFGLPFKAIGAVKSLFSDKTDENEGELNTFRLTNDESKVVEALNNRIGANVDTKTSVITLTATMQDPMVAALLCDSVAERLKKYVTDYRTNKAVRTCSMPKN